MDRLELFETERQMSGGAIPKVGRHRNGRRLVASPKAAWSQTCQETAQSWQQRRSWPVGLDWPLETRLTVQTGANAWAGDGDHDMRTALCAVREDGSPKRAC